ncbi:hypothetical protein [Eubacterium maltosivorans]|uniref:hypothetical protein n=1 Tax=Eubacterium maltosivorans TaxID=2041044 RepID=UPI001FAB5DB3|nr:hypothetical protein [Eubacterium maltosivorans]
METEEVAKGPLLLQKRRLHALQADQEAAGHPRAKVPEAILPVHPARHRGLMIGDAILMILYPKNARKKEDFLRKH